MIYTPWPFQEVMIQKTVDYVNSYNGVHKSGYNIAPTGTGKSLMIAHVVKRLARPTLILQPSKELLKQNYEKFSHHGGMATIFSASAGSKMSSSCTFATPGSVVNFGELFRRVYGVDTLIIDECHFKVKQSTEDGVGQVLQFIRDLQPKSIIGFTATPIRLQTSGMGTTLSLLHKTKERIFNDVIDVVQIQDILEYWKEVEYDLWDFDEGKLKLNSTGSDFTEESMIQAVRENNVNNNVLVQTIKKIREGKKAILIFCDSVENGHKMVDFLNNQKGIPSAMVSGKTPKLERDKAVKDFTSGVVKVMVNHSTFTTGFDYPALDCIMLGRPTNSFSLLYQMIGRLVRRHDIIKKGLCIDFCNNIKRLGYIQDVNFEKLPGYGWGMFNGEELMSDRPSSLKKITKKDLVVKAQFDKKTMEYDYAHIGKYYGTHFSEIPTEYLLYMKKTVSNLKDHKMQLFWNRLHKELDLRGIK